jgi:hypothetical protein
MKAQILTCVALLIADTFGASIGDRYYSPFPAQIGDKRATVENEYGDPYAKFTRQIAGRSVEVARYAYKERGTVTVFYVKDTCVAVRISSVGEIGPEDVLSVLRPFSIDGKPWELSSLDTGSQLGKKFLRKDQLEGYVCSSLRNKRLAVLTRTTDVIRGKAEIKSWDVLVYSDEEKEVVDALRKDKI